MLDESWDPSGVGQISGLTLRRIPTTPEANWLETFWVAHRSACVGHLIHRASITADSPRRTLVTTICVTCGERTSTFLRSTSLESIRLSMRILGWLTVN